MYASLYALGGDLEHNYSRSLRTWTRILVPVTHWDHLGACEHCQFQCLWSADWESVFPLHVLM